jgi:hypothetical protein
MENYGKAHLVTRKLVPIFIHFIHLSIDSLGQFTGHGSRSADLERIGEMNEPPYSMIPSIFDHVVRNPSTIESNYQ